MATMSATMAKALVNTLCDFFNSLAIQAPSCDLRRHRIRAIPTQYEKGELANFQKYHDASRGAFKSGANGEESAGRPRPGQRTMR